MTAKLLGTAGEQCCVTEDVSEGGLYLCVPSEVGLCVGQRCELVLVADDESDQQSSLTDEPIFATVMRTSVVMHGGSRFIGAGMRFDQPLYL